MKPSNEPFLLKASFISFSLASAMIVSVFSASAEDVIYLKGSKGYSTAFADAKWSEKAADPSVRDYLVADGYYYANKNGETVPAKSLTIGVVGGTAGLLSVPYEISFAEGAAGLVLANGTCQTRYNGARKIAGTVTVTAPAETPFVFNDISIHDGNKPYRDGCGIEMPGILSGASTVGIEVVGYTNGCVLNVSGDASAYYGSVVLRASDAFGASKPSAYLLLTGAAFGGSVTCTSNTSFRTAAGTSECSVRSVTLQRGAKISLAAPLTVGDFAFTDASAFAFAVDPTTKTTAGFMTVTNSISYAGGGKIPVSYSYTSGSFSLPPKSAISVPLFALAAEVDLEEDDFELQEPIASADKTMYLKMSVDLTTGTKLFSLEAYPKLMREEWPNESGDYGASGGSGHQITDVHFEDPEMWPDGQIPHAGAHYGMDRVTDPTTGGHSTTYARTPYRLDGEYRFLGESFACAQSCHLVLMSLDNYFKRVDLSSGNYIYCSYDSDVALHGNLFIGAGNVTVQPANDHVFTLDGELLGSGTLTIRARSAAADGLHGYARLSGTNSAYTGKILATIGIAAGKTPRWKSSRFASLYVSDARNFGGPRTEFACDALKLANMAELIAERDVTFDDQTRGLMLTNIAQLTVQDANVLTLKQPVTVDATVYKNGTGTLAMGGTLKFVGADAALTDVVPEGATNHMLIVTGGTLKPIAARSMDGLDIVFTDKGPMDGYKFASVSLAIDAAATDAELKQYGFINLKTANPLAIDGKNLASVPVTFENLPQEDLKETFSVPICTVRKSVAADVLALLVPAEKRVMLGNVKAKITLSASEPFTLDGFEAVTIKADVTPPAGLLLLVR